MQQLVVCIHHDFEPSSIVWPAQASHESGLIESFIAGGQTTGSVGGADQMHTNAQTQTTAQHSTAQHTTTMTKAEPDSATR